VDGIRAALDAGVDLHAHIDGKSVVTTLTEMYYRSDQFAPCLQLLQDRGGMLDDPVVAPVLLNDVDALATAIGADPDLLQYRTTMVSAFTPLVGATLLHVAAEYGHLAVARVLIDMGADVNARAALDESGMNGHTPIFHTVNSNANRSAPVMKLLLEAGAHTDAQVAGITWGKGFDWETTCFDVTPISYAQCGLFRQFQRSEEDTYANVRVLLEAAGRVIPPLDNVPNRYLAS
jgi:ankyrin repeat protein